MFSPSILPSCLRAFLPSFLPPNRSIHKLITTITIPPPSVTPNRRYVQRNLDMRCMSRDVQILNEEFTDAGPRHTAVRALQRTTHATD